MSLLSRAISASIPVFMIAALVGGVELFGSACTPNASVGRPSDNELRSLHARQAPVFDELRDMITADADIAVVGEDHVGNCWIDGARGPGSLQWACGTAASVDEKGMLASTGLSSLRYTHYRDLLHLVGAHQVAVHPSGDVEMAIFRDGVATSGTSKGILWASNGSKSPLVRDTDHGRPVTFAINYARIDGPWFIEHSSN
jgi:hypothetical protein